MAGTSVTNNDDAARGGFQGQTCSAPEDRTRRMAEIVLGYVDRSRALRILDLGCGTGQLAFRLADALPAAEIVGLDISTANVDAANAAREGRDDRARLRFTQADYLVFADAPFDLVVTDGVLHLIPVDDDTLVGKLAADTRANGLLVVCMPHQCAFNTAFSVTRKALRAVRGPLLDRIIKTVGHVLHPDASDAMLAERVHYMYRPPERVMDGGFTAKLNAAGLQRRATHAMPSSSLAQLRHSVTVWHRAGMTT